MCFTTGRASSPVGGPSQGRPRREAILALVPALPPVVDIGCDHGHTAHAIGAIATERQPWRLPARDDVRRVVADGLAPFREVGVAIITGIGAWQISQILARGPRPQVAVVHAPDRPAWLRRWCAQNGWRIDAERLAPEGQRFAEVLRIVPGREPHRGLLLEFGPCLLDDPLLASHATHELDHWRWLLRRLEPHDPQRAGLARHWIRFLEPLAAGTGQPGPDPLDGSVSPA